MRKKGILIGVGALLVIGAIAAGGGKSKAPDVTVVTDPPAAVTATAAPTKPTEAPLQKLEPVGTTAPAPERSVPDSGTTPTPAPERDYVINTNTGKFHVPNCSSVADIKSANRKDVHMTREEVVAMGFAPCGRCKP